MAIINIFYQLQGYTLYVHVPAIVKSNFEERFIDASYNKRLNRYVLFNNEQNIQKVEDFITDMEAE